MLDVDPTSFKYLVTIQKPVTGVPNAYGEPQTTYETLTEPRAKAEPLNMREVERAKSIGVEANYRFTIRYRLDVTTKQRLIFRGRTFLINSVVNVQEQNTLLEILAVELT